MDTIPLLVLVSCAVAVVAALWQALRRPQARPALPYTKRPALLTPGEMRFYRVLRQGVPEGVTVFVKVRLMDVVSVPDSAWHQFGAPGSGMHLDFILADAASLEVCLVIELDDKSHARPEARQRDAFKDAALAAAGVPVLRVAAARRYEVAELRVRIEAAHRGG